MVRVILQTRTVATEIRDAHLVLMVCESDFLIYFYFVAPSFFKTLRFFSSGFRYSRENSVDGFRVQQKHFVFVFLFSRLVLTVRNRFSWSFFLVG